MLLGTSALCATSGHGRRVTWSGTQRRATDREPTRDGCIIIHYIMKEYKNNIFMYIIFFKNYLLIVFIIRETIFTPWTGARGRANKRGLFRQIPTARPIVPGTQATWRHFVETQLWWCWPEQSEQLCVRHQLREASQRGQQPRRRPRWRHSAGQPYSRHQGRFIDWLTWYINKRVTHPWLLIHSGGKNLARLCLYSTPFFMLLTLLVCVLNLFIELVLYL